MKESNLEKTGIEIGSGEDRAAIGGGERVIHDFAERLRISHISLMRAQSLSYRQWLNAVFGDVQVREEYLGGFHVHVGEE